MIKRSTLIALTILSSTPVMAKISSSGGISGDISLSAGFSSSESNFYSDNSATITDNTQKGESDSQFIPIPLGNIAYTFGQSLDKQIYLGTSREDIAIGTLALELGFKQQLANGTVIDASFLPTIMSGETWDDPFEVGSARGVTDEEGNAYRLRFANIGNSGFTLDTAYAEKEIENEKSGHQAYSTSEQDLLRRDATSIYTKGSFRFPISRGTFLSPSVTYIKTDADGDANSNTSWSGELSMFKVMDRHQLALTAGYTDRSYDASHPVYNMVRDDSELSLFAAYEYKGLMGWDNWSLISFAGYGQTDSNIDFYDEKSMIFSVGVNCKF